MCAVSWAGCLRVVELHVRKTTLPETALLQRYAKDEGFYTDCFSTCVAQKTDLSGLIDAFYNSWLFRLERLILRVTSGQPVTDADVEALARQDKDQFAVWAVEARETDQILLTESLGRTSSWLSVEPFCDGQTRILFGSAIALRDRNLLARTVIAALTRFHTLYSYQLLKAAARRLSL